MKLLAYVHGYPPVHNAGSEMVLHTLFREMVRRGHKCQVITDSRRGEAGEYQGVKISTFPQITEREKMNLFNWADIIVTHLDWTKEAFRCAKIAGKPVVSMIHNDRFNIYGTNLFQSNFLVFNSEWVKRVAGSPTNSIVISPPVCPGDYRTERGETIALINLNQDKGAAVFYELAKRFPGKKFLGVRGVHGRQVVPVTLPENVTILDNTAEMRDIYSKIRVLLMPSVYESWGRVGIEAAASGIPTIAHPTPGLKESLGYSGLFADRNRIEQWVKIIQALDNPEHYAERSELAKKRADELDPDKNGNFDLFERSLVRLLPQQLNYRVDFFARERHFADHLRPIYNALPAEYRGEFITNGNSVPRTSGPVVTAASGDLRIASDSTGRPQIFCEHGAGQSYSNRHPSYAGGNEDRERVVMFLCPNEFAAGRNRQYYPRIPAVVIGCPKLDEWHIEKIKQRSNPPVVAISFHWDCQVCPETRSAWSYFKSALPRLVEAAKAGKYRLIGHGHPRIINQIAPEYERLGIEVVREFRDVLERADLYVIDNSSTLFEFASTGRPVVAMNPSWYRRNINHGLRFWECAGVGLNCNRPEDLPRVIEIALEDSQEQRRKREEIINKVYPIHDGTAAKRAAFYIIQAVEQLKQRSTKEETDMVKMTAERSFTRDPQINLVGQKNKPMILAGDVFECNEGMARQLEGRKLAKRIIEAVEITMEEISPESTKNKQAGSDEIKLVDPSETKTVGPSETKKAKSKKTAVGAKTNG